MTNDTSNPQELTDTDLDGAAAGANLLDPYGRYDTGLTGSFPKKEYQTLEESFKLVEDELGLTTKLTNVAGGKGGPAKPGSTSVALSTSTSSAVG